MFGAGSLKITSKFSSSSCMKCRVSGGCWAAGLRLPLLQKEREQVGEGG